ncbi:MULTISPECIES: nucleotidyltransferase family protein [unclassified Rathayibacter]|uniref:nucleotidyltransferase family protein n=1 Tax=unclassified Rathayibacter TaxID=2609250 RepID=UPI00104BB4A3|nr:MULTISPECIES: nucleotidyltransferase family protein [unclassified Rathayibacter]TCL84422.1 putative nucleotidyltransferase-like protein [Rathayibacter sp. PhB192]TCM30140.1 putative nucleotidyltransferase-like protein [Rathayibacter sp. PhB179]
MDNGTPREAVNLPLKVAVELAHALAQHIASERGIRVVFIKGPIANHHGLRPERVSSDVDVLVDPTRFDDYVAALEIYGWQRRPGSAAHEAFVTHSVSLANSGWPLDIDVHHAYPGVFASDMQLFEVVWRNRTFMEIAGRPITIADFDTSLLIAVLHSLRSMYFSRQQQEYHWAVEAVQAHYPTVAERSSLISLVQDLGCEEPLVPFLTDIGLPVTAPDTPSAEYLRWKVKSTELNRAASWLLLISEASGAARLRFMVRAVFPTRRDLELDHPTAADGVGSRARLRVRRALAAISALPAAIRIVGEARDERQPSVVARMSPRTTATGLVQAAAKPSVPEVVASTDYSEDRVPVLKERRGRDGSFLSLKRADAVAYVEGTCTYVLGLSAAPSRLAPIVLTGTAHELWVAIEVPTTLNAVVTDIADRTGLPDSSLRESIDSFFVHLAHLSVVERG